MKTTTVKTLSISEVDFSYIPPILYKYRCWSNLDHQKVISEQQIFFSHPKNFEDLKDCRIPVNFDFSYNTVLREISEDVNYKGLNKSELEVIATRIYNERFCTSKKRRQRRSEFYDSMNDRLGIFSAAKKPTLTSMRNKYSNQFDGFCVGFDYQSVAIEMGERYGVGSCEIDYQDELETLPDPFSGWDDESYKKFVFRYVNGKENKWNHENEFRLFLIYYESIFPKVRLTERQISLPKGAFKEIIFGYKLSSSSRDEIFKAVEKAHLHVQFKEAQIVDSQVFLEDLI